MNTQYYIKFWVYLSTSIFHIMLLLYSPSTDAVIKLWLDGIALVCVVKEFLEIGWVLLISLRTLSILLWLGWPFWSKISLLELYGLDGSKNEALWSKVWSSAGPKKILYRLPILCTAFDYDNIWPYHTMCSVYT